jgi:regulator of PEP synthase PpsR (kinase-PPPase family)
MDIKQPLGLETKLPVGENQLIIYTLSDSSGETAEAVARAALVQFPPGQASIYRLPQARNKLQIVEYVRQIATGRSVLAYTLVLPELRETLEAEAKLHNLVTIDFLGPLISTLEKQTGSKPLSEPGRLHLLDETYFRRIEAVDFAIRFDDGKNPDGLTQADVILSGVSRTSKTPNSMYLAHHYGLRAANVPIVSGVDPPEALFKVDPHKIIGMTIDPLLLHDIRSMRAKVLGMSPETDYADLEKIRTEVRYARRIFRDLKCHVIDVSSKAIEEISSEVYLHLRQ